MKTTAAMLAMAFSLALAGAALAQSGDAKYCNALSDTYTKYVTGSSEHKSVRPPPADVSTAMSKCGTDTASSIGVLEKALNDAKVPLPPRG